MRAAAQGADGESPLVIRIAVLADTHITRSGSRRLGAPILRELEGVDRILHAGDIVVGEVLDELAAFAPLDAVLGNNDEEALADRLREREELEIGGVRIGMIHDSGPRTGRERRLHRLFPSCDVVVFGHSHIPWDAPGVDGQLLFNPGSPTERRRQPHRTLGILILDDGRVVEARHVVVD